MYDIHIYAFMYIILTGSYDIKGFIFIAFDYMFVLAAWPGVARA